MGSCFCPFFDQRNGSGPQPVQILQTPSRMVVGTPSDPADLLLMPAVKVSAIRVSENGEMRIHQAASHELRKPHFGFSR